MEYIKLVFKRNKQVHSSLKMLTLRIPIHIAIKHTFRKTGLQHAVDRSREKRVRNTTLIRYVKTKYHCMITLVDKDQVRKFNSKNK